MKTISWNRKQFRQRAVTCASMLTACLGSAISATAQTATNAPAKPADSVKLDADAADFNNWVEVGAGGSAVSGDRAQYQKQSGLPGSTAFGGVQAFHYETPVDKKGMFSMDGRGIFDNHDYDLKLDLDHPDIGYLRAGVRQYRVYYDGTGGYLPSVNLSFPRANNEFFIDRGTAFFEGGLTLPNWPVFKIRYEHDYRSGSEDSTEWGQTTLTPGAVQKKIAPAFRLLDEKSDIFTVDVTHTIKDTGLGLGIRYEWDRNNDSQNILFQPNQGANSRTLTQSEFDKSDIFNVHGFTDTSLTEQLEFTTGYAYTDLHSEVNGSRVDDPSVPATTDTRYVNLGGGSSMQQYEADLNLRYSPTENIYIVPAARIEREVLNGADSDNSLTTTAGHNVVGPLTENGNSSAAVNSAQSLDARYVGVTNWVFYVRAEWEENQENLKELSGLSTLSPAAQVILDDESHQFVQKYSIGANWYPLRNLNFSGQYYYKLDNNKYGYTVPIQPSAGYVGFIQQEDFETHDVNFRGTWRPFAQLTLISRYDFQYSTINMIGGALGDVQSGETTTHMFSETVSWTPINRLYVEAGLNYVLDTTHTGAEDWAPTVGVIQPSQNNYWTVNGTVGYAFNDKNSLRATYTYYRSQDYTDNSGIGLPLGAGGEQTTVAAVYQRQISKNMRWALSYSFSTYRDQLFGGNLDYASHTFLSSIQYRF